MILIDLEYRIAPALASFVGGGVQISAISVSSVQIADYKIQKSEIQEDKFILDDIFAESAPIGKSSPAIFN